jgi:hypothetical protein
MSARKLAKPIEKQPFDSPLEELSYLLSRLEQRILNARESYRNAVVHPPEDSPKPPRKGRFSFGLRSKSSELKLEAESKQGDNGAGSKDDQEDSSADPSSAAGGGEPKAKFIHIPEEEEFIEDLRRAAELVVIGENYVTNLQKKKDKKWMQAKEEWSSNRDELSFEDDDPEEDEEDEEDNIRMVGYMDLFDHFFERNALDMIVNMLMGSSFDFSEEVSQARANEKAPESGNSNVSKDSSTDD